jgi:DNA-directed RNA polymerase specialized sigma24 family protein
MSLATLSGMNRDALMKHLESLFALAQVVTPDAEHAAQLVDLTYKRASDAAPDFKSIEEARIWLFQLLMEVHNETQQIPDLGESDSRMGHAVRPSELADFRRRLAEDFIDRTVPSAFAALRTQQRTILMLCDVEGIPCEEAGRVLGIDPLDACTRLDDSRLALRQAVFRSATDAEQDLLETGIAANWMQAALQRMANSQLIATPPTLRSSVAAIFRTEPAPGSVASTSTVRSSANPIVLNWSSLLKKFGAMVLVVAVAGLLGYGFTSFMNRGEPDLNLISLSARQAESVVATFQTASPEQAERYIYDRLGSRITVPSINEATLQGLSIREIADGADVPVLLFQDFESGKAITIYVYSYAFLDRHEQRLVLERDILRQIEAEGNFDLHDLGETKALIWRYRDDIFVAITSGDAEQLRGRISPPA